MIFAATTFCDLVNVDELDRFHTLVSCKLWNALPDIFQSALQSSRGKYRVYLDVDSFCLQNVGTGAE